MPNLFMHGNASLPASCRQHPGRCLRHAGRHGEGAVFGGHGLTAPLLDRAQVLGMGGEHHLQRLSQVLQQVKAVGNLDSRGCAVAGALGIGTGAIA
jgi:aldehyde:ferredoxin oxidoreductase